MEPAIVFLVFMFAVFSIGYIMGRASSKDKTEEWLEENGCYSCKEAYDYDSDRLTPGV
jgi:hypothetical protein